MPKNKTQSVVVIPHADWIALTDGLKASPDISIKDLTLKVRRLITSRAKYAREVVELEAKLLKKCPELDK